MLVLLEREGQSPVAVNTHTISYVEGTRHGTIEIFFDEHRSVTVTGSLEGVVRALNGTG